MNKEQLRTQMLAGIITEGQYKAKLNEIKVNKPGRYNSFFQAHLDQEEEIIDYDPDGVEIINSFRNKNITSLDELANNIEDLEFKLTETVSDGSEYDFAFELAERLENLMAEKNLSPTFHKELFDKLSIKYIEYGESMDWDWDDDEYENPFNVE